MLSPICARNFMEMAINAHNVFPSEIAEVIKSHYAVKDCIVIGVKDPGIISGEWPTAYIELKREYLEDADRKLCEVIKLCTEKLPLRDRPRECDFYQVNKIVSTVEGKTNERATVEESNIINWKTKVRHK